MRKLLSKTMSFVTLGRHFAFRLGKHKVFSVYVVSVLINVNHFSILRRTITYLGGVLTQFFGKDTSKRLSFCCWVFIQTKTGTHCQSNIFPGSSVKEAMTSTYLLNKSSNTEKLYQRLLFGIFNIFNCYIDYFRDLPFRRETMFLPYVVAILINLSEVILAV